MKNHTTPKFHDVSADELLSIVERVKETLNEADHAKLRSAVDTLTFLTVELQSKRVSIDRLRKLLFGAATEKTSDVLGEKEDSGAAPDATEKDDVDGEESEKKKRPGHGRNPARAYKGAKKVNVPHPSMHNGDACPDCQRGRVYPMAEPAVLVRVTGMAPLNATVYEQDRLRCNACGEVFTAPAPDGIGKEKYDESATSMVALLKYGAGVPFYRIQKLQKNLGIPLPATTQWEIVREGAKKLAALHKEVIRQAAQGEVLHNDDTTMKVLSLTPAERAKTAADNQTDSRTGVFTSGIVATREGQKFALFFTGVKHAGENLADVLARREPELGPPIQMCDALSRNTSGEFKTIVANCLAHSRRKFVEVVNDFPEECRYVLETLRDVYRNDAASRGMSPQSRLEHHKAMSEPLMNKLSQWLKEQIDEHKVEPNSGLGEAIAYMDKHWDKLTLFLSVPGAPLDNNIVERSLKKAILHRKNALFYKTLNGARTGDVFMSLIHTCELNGVTPFDYLFAVLKHHRELALNAGDWMPWNYEETLATLTQGPALPA